MAEVTDHAARNRFEMVVDQETAFVIYVRHGDRLTLVHTEVPQAMAGHGVGSALAHAVLEEVRRRGLHVVPRCAFMAAFIARHPEFADLVAS
jgi:predicted GNAT family acetyltransferase